MIKVLIVDDEPKIREGLKAIIPWDSLGFSVAGTASNGHEALELYDEIQPELVVADIRMPGMDGLTLIQRLRERDEKLHILILSGYADFDYARKAISNRADGYLLKPVDEDEMISYLEKIQLDCREQHEKERWTAAAGKWTKDIVIQSLLSGPAEAEVPSLAEKAKEMGLDAKEYQVLLVEPYRNQGAALEAAELEEIALKIAEHFEKTGQGIPFTQHAQSGVLLTRTIVGSQMRKQLGEELETLLENGSIKMTAALGPLARKLEDIAPSYRQARELLKRHFFAAEDGVLSEESMTGQEGHVERPDNLEDRLYYAMDIGNLDALQPLIHSAGSWLLGLEATEAEIKRYFAELLASLLSRLSAHHEALSGCLKSYTDQIALIYQQRSLLDLYRHIDTLLDNVLKPLGKRTQEQDLKALLDMIHRNYSENLKLETLAGVFNYNTAYLGKMFKHATGEYFNTYLDKVRIEHAKQFLQQGMKVYQVAEKVGYTHVDYFHSKFRKYVGTSPSSYKKQGDSQHDA